MNSFYQNSFKPLKESNGESEDFKQQIKNDKEDHEKHEQKDIKYFFHNKHHKLLSWISN